MLCTLSPPTWTSSSGRQAGPRACWQLELTFHGELSLHLVQFILKRNTENPIRKQPAEKLSPYLQRTREVSRQDICTSHVLRIACISSKHQATNKYHRREHKEHLQLAFCGEGRDDPSFVLALSTLRFSHCQSSHFS